MGIRETTGPQVYDGTSNVCYVPRFSSTNERNGYAVSDAITLPPGTYEIGVAINGSANYFDYNEFVMGYIMVINY